MGAVEDVELLHGDFTGSQLVLVLIKESGKVGSPAWVLWAIGQGWTSRARFIGHLAVETAAHAGEGLIYFAEKLASSSHVKQVLPWHLPFLQHLRSQCVNPADPFLVSVLCIHEVRNRARKIVELKDVTTVHAHGPDVASSCLSKDVTNRCPSTPTNRVVNLFNKIGEIVCNFDCFNECIDWSRKHLFNHIRACHPFFDLINVGFVDFHEHIESWINTS